jgi:hypothetical protein
MISFTREINEETIFEDLKDCLFQQGVYDNMDYIGNVENLPEEVQRLIFAKVGAMMIDYAGSEEF